MSTEHVTRDLRSLIRSRAGLSIGVACGVAALICISSSGCRRDESPQTSQEESGTNGAWFEDVAAEAGVNFIHIPYTEQRFYLPEIMSGGVALLDYDGDGHLDIYFVQGGDLEPSTRPIPGNRLFRNRGDGTFIDVTDAAGVGDAGYGMGCTSGDYDNDGDVDLYVTNVGPNVLYRNDGGGTFTDVTAAAGVGDPSWGASCAFVDYDADGHLDILVANYVNWTPERELDCKAVGNRPDYCSPKAYQAPARDTLYRSRGDGTFVDVTEAAGLGAAFGNGLGVVWGDFDSDDRIDMYVANDAMENQLWINGGDGTFTDQALLAGCALSGMGAAEAGMGVMAVDIEHDGDLDLFLSHIHTQSNTFYLNEAGLFDDITPRMGLASASLPFTGFGLGFVDFDHDGRLDLFVANGKVEFRDPVYAADKPYAEPNLLFRGRDDGRFTELIPRGGTKHPLIENSRAAAFGDLDNDGDVDVVVVNLGAPVHVLRNVVGSHGNWIMFRLVSRWGSDALGARVLVNAGGRKQWRTVQTAYSYCASNDPRVHFGLGVAPRVDEVSVLWPGGRRELFGPFAAGRIHELTEATGRAVGGV